MRLAHPAEPDDSDADSPRHGRAPSAVTIGQRGSVVIPCQVSRIQPYGGSSTVAIVRSGFGPAITFR